MDLDQFFAENSFFSQHSVISIKLVPADLTHKSSSSLSLSETKSDEENVVVAKKYTCSHCQVFTDNFNRGHRLVLEKEDIISILFLQGQKPKGGNNFKYNYEESRTINTSPS